MKKLWLGGIILLAASMSVNAAPQKIAVMNVQQVLQQSSQVTDLSKKLEAQFKKRQQGINDRQKKLQDDFEKYKKESPTMTEKNKAVMQKQLADRRSEVVKEVMAYQQDLTKEQGKMLKGVLSDLNAVVSKIAKTEGAVVVLDAQAVVFFDNSEVKDITTEVAKDFNGKK